MLADFSVIFLSLISNLIPLCLKNILHTISILLNLLKCFMAQDMVDLDIFVLGELGKNEYFTITGWNVL